jgi:magnesium-transporting ATPase (P-type)
MFVLGIVVYSGVDTRVVRNSREAPSKLSSIEKTMNRLIYLIFATQCALSLVSLLFFLLWNSINYENLPYLCYLTGYNLDGVNNMLKTCCNSSGANYDTMGYFLTFFILYNNFIPISLYVTVEICNYFQVRCYCIVS